MKEINFYNSTIPLNINLDIKGMGSHDLPYFLLETTSDHYRFDVIDFKPGDIVIDIGANIGTTSLYLAKKFPFIKIISIEPIPITYMCLVRNINANMINNIIPLNFAVTSHENPIEIYVHYNGPAGASSIVTEELDNHEKLIINSITLDQVFEFFNIEQCKLLKIDCEGAEYDILYNTKILTKVEYIRAELHFNKTFSELEMNYLADYCARIIGYYPKMFYESCRMAD